MSLLQEGSKPRKDLFKKGATLIGVATLLANAGCSSSERDIIFKPCSQDSQPTTIEIALDKSSFWRNGGTNPQSVTIGNVQLIPGINNGEFGSRFISTTPTIVISPIENGIAFKDPQTERKIQIKGDKNRYSPGAGAKLSIEATCDR